MKNRMEILKYVVLGAVIAFTLLFITGQLKMTEKYESGDDIQAEIDKLLAELDTGAEASTDEGEEEESDDEDESDDEGMEMMAPGPM
jgi:Ran GTPase-activating protein (RanGAP) involved in mRNA processing and transport